MLQSGIEPLSVLHAFGMHFSLCTEVGYVG
jgi:hypothetical protein